MKRSFLVFAAGSVFGFALSFMVTNRLESGPGKTYVVRVFGSPGDVVSVADKSVYLNGKKLEGRFVYELMRR